MTRGKPAISAEKYKTSFIGGAGAAKTAAIKERIDEEEDKNSQDDYAADGGGSGDENGEKGG